MTDDYDPELVQVAGGTPGVRYAKIPVDGLSFYAFGDDGSVWSRWSGVWRPIGPFPVTSGHLGVNLQFVSGKIRRFYVQWLICTAWRGPGPDGYEACHGDGNHQNNAVWNLRWDTQGNNNVDRTIHKSING